MHGIRAIGGYYIFYYTQVNLNELAGVSKEGNYCKAVKVNIKGTADTAA